ncbi:MAG: glucose-6-phosphate isomerase [Caldicoprobacterales bacterium]|jgi:glucose-6-phosphate isomerase|nr:glucose-6-phosphate isomerase [Clostridia bacterium]MDI9512190.1 glucose-6-phosphate isomerase [Bacillota bacterium]NLH58383.1 glucose-6-phosphate isomerase [Clostridiales bacterium]
MKRYEKREWKESMKITMDFNNMMSEVIGDEQGISKASIDQLSDRLKEAAQAMKDKRKAGKMDFRDLPYNQKDIVKDLIDTANKIKDRFDAFVVLGIGGSALGPIAVQQALNHMHYNELSKEDRGGYPRLYVVDNVDPERMDALFDVIDIEKTAFNVITKSGSTSETMSQFLIIQDMLKTKLGDKYQDHIIATTDAENGNLIKIAKQEGFKTFFIPRGVGGRFSELTPVGLLPAAVCGIDIEELLAGAAYADELSSVDNVYENMAYMAATLQYLAMKAGKNISVMMPYADSLKYMADWYAQLWAESLGKRYDLEGKEVFVGQTPVKALGVTDQHSQVQLYTEGPFDKVVTFLGVGEYRKTMEIARGYEDIPAVSFLGGHTLNELIHAEQAATEYALLKAKRLNRTITLPVVNAFTIGQLLYLLEVETAFAGELLNIDAFDQPGVEEGKNATYALLGRPGYEEKKQELDSRPKKKEEYII